VESEPDGERRPVVLVADDHADSRAILGRYAKRRGFEPIFAEDGEEAVRLVEEKRPDFVVLDVIMPKKTGFEALAEIRKGHPEIPVVIVSGADDPVANEEAIARGAVNFLRKPFDPVEVRLVLERVRAAVGVETDVRATMRRLSARHVEFETGNDLREIPRIVAFLGEDLGVHYPGVPLPATEVKLALYEALANAIEHGNLEIDYDAKSEAMDTTDGMYGVIARRAADPRYRDRRVHVVVDYEEERVVYRVRDEGPGFDHRGVGSAHRLGDTDALHGRGLLLIGHYMDGVSWNPDGNEITLVKVVSRRPRRGRRGDAAPASGA
jgi:CheY-like chemotaxis protein